MHLILKEINTDTIMVIHKPSQNYQTKLPALNKLYHSIKFETDNIYH